MLSIHMGVVRISLSDHPPAYTPTYTRTLIHPPTDPAPQPDGDDGWVSESVNRGDGWVSQ